MGPLIWYVNAQVRMWIILDINYKHYYHLGKSQICTGAGDYFRTSKPHSEKLWCSCNKFRVVLVTSASGCRGSGCGISSPPSLRAAAPCLPSPPGPEWRNPRPASLSRYPAFRLNYFRYTNSIRAVTRANEGQCGVECSSSSAAVSAISNTSNFMHRKLLPDSF